MKVNISKISYNAQPTACRFGATSKQNFKSSEPSETISIYSDSPIRTNPA